MKKTRVLVVDDSLFMRQFISDAINNDPALEVVGVAANPYEARDKLIELTPDVMTLDVEMPRMNGIDFLRKLLPQYPLPVIVVSSVSNVVFDAMNAGAVDFVSKTPLSDEYGKQAFVQELIVKIKIASIAKVGRLKTTIAQPSASNGLSRRIIAIGASTGGTEATATIMKELKRDLPGIVIVQHMPPVFTKLYSDRLNNSCPIDVKEAEDGDEVLPGRALLAPGDFQMEVMKRGAGYYVRVFKGEKVSGHCPSVDVLFESVAKAAGANALGVILTGMGSDGAKGMLSMHKQGARTFGQNKESCVVYGMPMVANELGAVDREIPLDQMAGNIYRWHDQMGK